MVRLTIIPTCIAQISRPEKLYVDICALVDRLPMRSLMSNAYGSQNEDVQLSQWNFPLSHGRRSIVRVFTSK